MPTFNVGDKVQMEATIKDSAEAALDPTDITLKYRKPEGTVTTVAKASMANPSTGVFQEDVIVASGEHGVWDYRFATTGNIVAATEDEFTIRDSSFD